MLEVKCRREKECCQDNSYCMKCSCNEMLPKIQYYFKPYIPVCPCGYKDCIYDPAYIKYTDPEWYKVIYGDKTPEEAVREDCISRSLNNESCSNYDDEDK